MKSIPNLLRPWSVRALRLLIEAIVSAHPDQAERADSVRVNEAFDVLMGVNPRRGAPEKDRDELLELLAFDYSVEVKQKKRDHVTPTEVARRLVDHHPSTSFLKGGKESIVRDLVRKFRDNESQLMAMHALDGSEDFDALLKPLAQAMRDLKEAGVDLDLCVLPSGAQRWSR